MGKYSAAELSLAGDKYLGRLYADMDCQGLVENMMRDVGLRMDLKGSNAWYREVMRNGWVGTPEACKGLFGCVPKGAFLFIHALDGGEVARGYKDGLGNAKHIGIKTGRSGEDMVRRAAEAGVKNADKWDFGDGAIHSSSTREHVATSKFADKTISGGGWNKVGLYNKFSYGDTVDRILAELSGGGSGEDEKKQEESAMYDAYLEGGKASKPINIRKKPEGDLQDTLPQGSRVTVIAESGDWCKVEYRKGGRTVTGYVNGEFVVVADDDEPVDAGVPDEPDGDDGNERVTITLTMTVAEAAAMLPVLEKLASEIVDKAGRG